MQLSETTIQVLRNFASINPSIKILQGSTLATVAEAKNILAKATIPDEFPQEFGIYDLNSFLSTISLVDNPFLKFEEKFVTITGNRTRVKYFFDMTQEKGKTDIIMPEPVVKFTLTQADLAALKKAAGTLGHDQIVIQREDKSIKISVMDVENATSNVFSIDMEGELIPDKDFKFVFNIANLKMIGGDYVVEISDKLISRFVNTESELEYFVAVERTSEY